MTKGIIFDMDGLLVDSERLTFQLIKEELNKTGKNMTEEFYKSLLGRTYDTAHPLFLETYGDDFDDKKLTATVNERLIECYKNKQIKVKKGVVEFLGYLKEKHIKMVVATSTPRETAELCLKGANLYKYFDDFVCGDEVENGKPNPEVFLKALNKLGCKKEEAFIFEDSEAGIHAAYSAGINVICIPDMKYPSPELKQVTYLILDTIDLAIPYII